MNEDSDSGDQGRHNRNSMKNNTDYDFPDMWGRMSKDEKSEWYTQERCRRQAMSQDTTFATLVRKQEDSDSGE